MRLLPDRLAGLTLDNVSGAGTAKIASHVASAAATRRAAPHAASAHLER